VGPAALAAKTIHDDCQAMALVFYGSSLPCVLSLLLFFSFLCPWISLWIVIAWLFVGAFCGFGGLGG
jgi:RsiW-degrading membrane proteinase PrsW (M82 family)